MKNVQSKTGSFTSKGSTTSVTNAASMARKKTITKKDVSDNTAEKEVEEEPPSPQPDCADLQAEANMDKALAQFGALGMMGKGIMQTVPEEN